MRQLLISVAAGAAVFLTLRVLMDLSVFPVAPQAEFLRPPAGGLPPEAALEYANWATASYWIALVVAVIVLIVTPLVRWSATWPGPEAGPPLAPRDEAGQADGRRPPELWPDAESEKRWRTPAPARPAPILAETRGGGGDAPARAPAPSSAAHGAAAGAAWTPPANPYAQAVKSRYGAARLRPSRKVAEAPRPRGAARAARKG